MGSKLIACYIIKDKNKYILSGVEKEILTKQEKWLWYVLYFIFSNWKKNPYAPPT